MKRRGNWMQTAMGREFWPLDPRAEEVHFDDIAISLSHQVRFAGHAKGAYTVAQHSVLVSDLIEKMGHGIELQRAGLMHDASEAYCVDVPRPIKGELKGYKEIETGVQLVIGARFGIDPELFECGVVKLADNVILSTEKRDVMRNPPRNWETLPDPVSTKIVILEHGEAMYEFAVRARELGLDVML